MAPLRAARALFNFRQSVLYVRLEHPVSGLFLFDAHSCPIFVYQVMLWTVERVTDSYTSSIGE